MPIPALPTLSSSGILTEPKQVADYLFRSFMASENSQSSHYPIYSLPYLVEKSTGRVGNLPDEIAEALRSMYESYFESVTVDVRLEENLVSPELLALVIRMTLSIDGKMYDLARLVEKIADNVFTEHPI